MPGYRLGTCLGCPEDACELSIFLLCSLVCYRPLASILLLHLSACCNHQDISKAIDVCKSLIVLRRRTAVFSRANLEHTASAQPVHNFTLVDYARIAVHRWSRYTCATALITRASLVTDIPHTWATALITRASLPTEPNIR